MPDRDGTHPPAGLDLRIEELEAVVYELAIDEEEYACISCDGLLDRTPDGRWIGHRAECIVLTLPAPETVETQG